MHSFLKNETASLRMCTNQQTWGAVAHVYCGEQAHSKCGVLWPMFTVENRCTVNVVLSEKQKEIFLKCTIISFNTQLPINVLVSIKVRSHLFKQGKRETTNKSR